MNGPPTLLSLSLAASLCLLCGCDFVEGLLSSGDPVREPPPPSESWQQVPDRFQKLLADAAPTEEEIERLRRELDKPPGPEDSERSAPLTPEERAERAEAAARAAAERRARVTEAMAREQGNEPSTPRRARLKRGRVGVKRGPGKIALDEVRRTVGRRLGGVKVCYERQLRDPATMGTVSPTMEITISPDGRAKTVEISMLPDGGQVASQEGFFRCLKGVLSSTRFPQPEGGEVTISYPFWFEPVER